VIGAFALTIIEEYAQDFGEYNAFVYGLVLALVILYLPKGLVDLPNKIKSIVSR
jgi:branched-chain amino acid transport system permease protein